MKKIFLTLAITAVTLPVAANAFTFTGNTCSASGNFSGVKQYICDIADIIDMLIPVLVGAALLVFAWGIVKFIANAGNEKARDAGKQLMIWGIIALFVFSSIGGIIYFLQQDLDIQAKPIDLPTFSN